MGHEDAIPPDHPRAQSLRMRERLVDGIDVGMTSQQGLIAHGRGEAFDYLIGERTITAAREAAATAAALLLRADHPVLSVNGNVAALAPAEMIALADALDAPLEVNLFHRTDDRVEAITRHLREHGAARVLGTSPTERLPNLSHDRALVDTDGIHAADVVLVPLEDGDRAEALGAMGKREIVIDLNPLSRSSLAADVPICDNLIRAVPLITEFVERFSDESSDALAARIEAFDADDARRAAERAIRSGDLDR